MAYSAIRKRYDKLQYRRCGNSGLQLPPITLGLWHNFGGSKLANESKKMIFRAFDRGITHFDLANNYGPPYGSAERNFGNLMTKELKQTTFFFLYWKQRNKNLFIDIFGNLILKFNK